MGTRLTASSAAALVILLAVYAPAQAQSTEPFDHLHLAVPDIEQARDWYLRHMGGNDGETPETIAFGKWPEEHPLPIQLLFSRSTDALPSEGSTLDHIGFSFEDLDAKVDELRAAGVEILSPVTEIPDLWKQAVVQDPWGTKLVLVEDPNALGLHHVELRVANPEASLNWYVRAFGGDRTKYKGQIDAVRYRDLGVFYLFVSKDDQAAPSEGHSLDHISFGPWDMDRLVNTLTADGATITSDPDPRVNPECRFITEDGESGTGVRRLYCAQPDSLPHVVVYTVAPDNVRIELVLHIEAGGH